MCRWALLSTSLRHDRERVLINAVALYPVQAELIVACKLADRIQASITVASCGKALSSIRIEQFEWDTVTTVFRLPPFCLEADAFRPAVQKAVDEMTSVLGDLEAVMNDTQLREQLLELPCDALAALLASNDLRVASENSAVAAVFAWVHAHGGSRQVGLLQLKQLVNQLRLSRMTHLYATELIPPKGRWFAAATGWQKLARLISMCALGNCGDVQAYWQEVLQSQHVPDAWLAPARPKSGAIPTIVLTIAASELRQLLKNDSGKWSDILFHCGRCFKVCAHIIPHETASNATEPCHTLGVHAYLAEEFGVPVLAASCTIIWRVQKQPRPLVYNQSIFLSTADVGSGMQDGLEMPVSQGSDMSQQLRDFLVDDKLTITVDFENMV
eukprot:jgi/Chrzof1/14528/Cz09g06050.t1